MAGVNDNLIPAKPGEIRNPKGKPKGTLNLSTRIQNMLNDDDFTTEMVMPDGKKMEFKGNPAEAIIRTALLKAMSGDNKWAEWLAKHGYGTKQTIEHKGDAVDAILEQYKLSNVDIQKDLQEEKDKLKESAEQDTTA